MPLTPADVHNVAFSKPPIGKRGYNEDEVDQFLDLVEDTLAQLQDDNDDLRAKLEQGGSAPAGDGVDEAKLRKEIEEELRKEYEAKLTDARKATEKAESEAKNAKAELQKTKAELEAAKKKAEQQPQKAAAVAAVPQDTAPATADTHMQAAKVLGLAQEMADRLTSEAQAESRSMLDEARTAAEAQLADADEKSQAQLADAKKRAEQQINEADTRAKSLVADAEKRAQETTNQATSRAEAQIRQAEEKANALQADAERKHTEIMATVKQQQTALETRIAELRTYEREYRTRPEDPAGDPAAGARGPRFRGPERRRRKAELVRLKPVGVGTTQVVPPPRAFLTPERNGHRSPCIIPSDCSAVSAGNTQ